MPSTQGTSKAGGWILLVLGAVSLAFGIYGLYEQIVAQPAKASAIADMMLLAAGIAAMLYGATRLMRRA